MNSFSHENLINSLIHYRSSRSRTEKTNKKRRKKRTPQSEFDKNKLAFPPRIGILRVYQEYDTCWIASVVFLVCNRKDVWDLMNRTVQDYLFEYFSDPESATDNPSMSYELRYAKEECRRMPLSISRHYNNDKFAYVSQTSGGYPDRFLEACAKASNLKLKTKCFPNKFRSLQLRKADLLLYTIWCVNPVPLFTNDLYNIILKFSTLIDGFYCVGGFISTGTCKSEHVMGFVREENTDEYILCQSWFSTSCTKVHELELIIPKNMGYDSERLRHVSTQKIFTIDLVFVRKKDVDVDLEKTNAQIQIFENYMATSHGQYYRTCMKTRDAIFCFH